MNNVAVTAVHLEAPMASKTKIENLLLRVKTKTMYIIMFIHIKLYKKKQIYNVGTFSHMSHIYISNYRKKNKKNLQCSYLLAHVALIFERHLQLKLARGEQRSWESLRLVQCRLRCQHIASPQRCVSEWGIVDYLVERESKLRLGLWCFAPSGVPEGMRLNLEGAN